MAIAADPYISKHLNWRLLQDDDLEEVINLRAQIEVLDESSMPAADRLAEPTRPGLQPGQGVGGWDNYGTLLAFAWNIIEVDAERPRSVLFGGVHPTRRYQEIGRSLLAWQEKQALAWREENRAADPLDLACYVEVGQLGLRHLLERRGFSEENLFYEMHRNLEELPEPPQVLGITVESFSVELAEKVRQLHNGCFSRREGVEPLSQRAFAEYRETPGFRPSWSLTATVDGELVGYLLAGRDEVVDGNEGWVDRIGVQSKMRGRGIALAMLGECLRRMKAEGCTGVGIGVDTVDPKAPHYLADQLGFETRDAVTLMSKRVAAR